GRLVVLVGQTPSPAAIALRPTANGSASVVCASANASTPHASAALFAATTNVYPETAPSRASRLAITEHGARSNVLPAMTGAPLRDLQQTKREYQGDGQPQNNNAHDGRKHECPCGRQHGHQNKNSH